MNMSKVNEEKLYFLVAAQMLKMKYGLEPEDVELEEMVKRAIEDKQNPIDLINEIGEKHDLTPLR